MNKPRFVISCPFDTYSGYGARSRDIVKAIIELDKYKVELLSQRWGETSWGFCNDNPEWKFLLNYAVAPDWQSVKPDIWMQITIPNEFAPVGKYNIGCTAGIESTACPAEWVEGLNRMNINWVSSKHSKNVFEGMQYEKKDKNTNQTIAVIKNTKPIHVVFEGVNLNKYKPIFPSEIKTVKLDEIKDHWCYLFVGHWMQGELGHDRKNVGLMIRTFFETFKNKKKKPALILKTSVGVDSYISRDEVLDRIKGIRQQVKSKDLPNIYLLSGNFSDEEMNELYNNKKIKSMISFTKGEGYGRPLLEFSLTGKPIIASGWSGQVDFLNKNFSILVGGQLESVHSSAANKWLIKESQWFKPDLNHINHYLQDVFNRYNFYKLNSKQQSKFSKGKFSFDKMKELLDNILDANLPKFAEQVSLKLPKLKKAKPELPKLQLPKLKKV
tara:strand:- start:410 stop:1729 length:1320 start_codon:yes stop_codon:yes gene_type:complete